LRGYLLDGNHIEALFREEPNVIQKIRSIPAENLLWVCNITLGEIEAGHRMTQTTDQRRRDEYTRFVNETFLHVALEVSPSTRSYYAEILGRIWHKHPPPPKKRTERHLLDLGVDINDVWNVAVAWEHGLVFVTEDNMACIKEAVKDDVTFECWLSESEKAQNPLVVWLGNTPAQHS
jgi:predicted nucleic acid-binding protein